VRQTGHSLWQRNIHSLQAIKCLQGSNSVLRSWSLQMMHWIRCCKLYIWLPTCCCVSFACVLEKYWSILQCVSLSVEMCCRRTKVFSLLIICHNSVRRVSMSKQRICYCKNLKNMVYCCGLEVSCFKISLT